MSVETLLTLVKTLVVELRDDFFLSKSDENDKITSGGRMLLSQSTTESNCIHSRIDQIFHKGIQ